MNANQKIQSSFEYSGMDIETFKQHALKYLKEEISKSNYTVFQSDFSFMNNDIPFTLIVACDKDNKFEIVWWLNDWGTFEIETPVKHQVAKYWKLKTHSDRLNLPDWKKHTAKSLIDKYGCLPLANTFVFQHKQNISAKELDYELKELLKEYDLGFNPDDSGMWEGKIACLYKEDI
jgi:hypothetical protein